MPRNLEKYTQPSANLGKSCKKQECNLLFFEASNANPINR